MWMEMDKKYIFGIAKCCIVISCTLFPGFRPLPTYRLLKVAANRCSFFALLSLRVAHLANFAAVHLLLHAATATDFNQPERNNILWTRAASAKEPRQISNSSEASSSKKFLTSYFQVARGTENNPAIWGQTNMHICKQNSSSFRSWKGTAPAVFISVCRSATQMCSP